MGGFFGATLSCECLSDVFFGVDYHSHLGTRRAGLAAYDKEIGLQRSIHNIKQRKGGIQLYHLSSQLHHFCENDQIEFSPSKVKIQ